MMFTILEALADSALLTRHFACDLSKCHGACCTMPGGKGAPLADAEVDAITQATPAARRFLDQRKKMILDTDGGVEGAPGDYATRCVDDRDCVYVYYDDNGVACCAIERAWHNGDVSFRKPLSCHLFPIRIHDLFGAPYLHYEKIGECEPARQRGRKEGIRMVEFLREPIIRAFGEQFYRELVKKADEKKAL